MHSPLAITACRILTPLDRGGESTWQALCAGKRIENNPAVDDAHLDPDDSLDRSLRLALAVAGPLVANPESLALFTGTSKGPVLSQLAALEKIRAGEPLSANDALHVILGPGAMGSILMNRLNLAGGGHTSVAACSSGLHALHRAATALRRGESSRALVVAADASLHPLFQSSFERLGVIAPADAKGIRRCEPFSPDARGFFLSEAAAAVLLETPDQLGSRIPLAWLEHSWIGGDGTNLIATDPAAKSLRTGLAAVGGSNLKLAFLHAHATGTAHDAHELAALRAFFPEPTPIFSHKKNLGHSLGAAGLLALCISALAHHHGQTPDGASVASGATSLTLAQGFGGHIAVARLRSA